jgi:hypothetical protein
VRILALPRTVTLRAAGLSYSARYARRGNLVTVRRALRFTPSGAPCTPEQFRRIQPLLERIARDLKSQIIVRAK